jgi:hypothetical protein
MTILISLFGFAGRIAGDLLTSALGWASSLLFGRVPRSHKGYLVLMMALSFLWVLFVLALLIPTVTSVLLATTPRPPFVDQLPLGIILLVGVIFLPMLVGLAGYLVPAEGERRDGLTAPLREVLRGYLLAPLISALLVFLSIVGIARKIRSKRHGWADDHVPIVVRPNGYDRLVDDLRGALTSAGLPVQTEDAPWVLTMPARLLTSVAGSNVRELRPDRLVNLVTPELRIGVYPSDIAISGPARERTRARAAIISRFATTAAHLTTSAEAQAVEDQIEKVAKSGAVPTADSASAAQAPFREIDEKLLELEVPTDEWDILYRLRVQVERDLLTGSRGGTASRGSGESLQADGDTRRALAGGAAEAGPPADTRARKAVEA